MPDRELPSQETGASIDGAPASLDRAVSVAADLISSAREPLFAGLGTDIAGARAAVRLAEQTGGVLDHAHSAAILRELDCMRETGIMLTTPLEARVRADTVLLAGDGLLEAWPELGPGILAAALPRRVIWLATDDGASLAGYEEKAERLTTGHGANRAAALATLRARVKRRPVAGRSLFLPRIDAIAEALRAARFGVAIFNAASFDAMEVEAINGLVRDLNETTRFSTLPLNPPDNGAGVLAACGWMTGFPMRTGFGLGMPAHDPWRFDSQRLVRSGETDCVAWVSALGAAWPGWKEAPDIALCDSAAQFPRSPKVRIAVGRPGVDHDAVLHDPETGSLIAVRASAPSKAPSVAKILGLIAARLAGERAAA